MIIWASFAPDLLYQKIRARAPHLMADDVGSLLLRAGLVSPDQLDAARKEVTNVGGTVPEQLVQQGHIADEALTAFYRKRLLIPRVNPVDLEKITTRLLDKVPPDMAAEFRSIPISLDHEGNLTLVMSDPSDSEAVDEIAFFTGNYVVRAIATQAQIAWCLDHYYKQKTKLFLGLVAEGQFSDESLIEPANSKLATIEMPRMGADPDGETGPMKTRRPAPNRKPAKQARSISRAETEDDPDSDTGQHKIVRPSNQQPSPAELFARSGEITSVELGGDHSVEDAGPAVVISMEPDQGGVVQHVDTTPDTAPILLTDIRKRNREAESESDEDPIVLTQPKRKRRRSSKRTNVGLGSVGAESAASDGQVMSPAPAADTEPAGSGLASAGTPRTAVSAAATSTKKKGGRSKKSKNASPMASAIRARSIDLVGGDWGAPGTTIPPGYLGASSYDDVDSAIPEAIADDSQTTSQMRAPDMSAPLKLKIVNPDAAKSGQSPIPTTSKTNDAATNLLLSVRAVDRADNRGDIVEAILDFLDFSYERTGFWALKQDDLVAWRMHNCADGAQSTICVTKDSTLRDVVRTRLPYNGPLEDAPTKKLASDLDIPDALDLLVLPISLRDRVIGTFVALSSFGPIKEDHILVLSQAASEGFERIVLARKK